MEYHCCAREQDQGRLVSGCFASLNITFVVESVGEVDIYLQQIQDPKFIQDLVSHLFDAIADKVDVTTSYFFP
jgi:hypothetical protein